MNETTKQEEAQTGSGSRHDRMVNVLSEIDCLACNPFEGDIGSPNDRILKDKMVTARKGGECYLCEQDIKAGERIRTMAAVFDGEMHSYRWCYACCLAMAKSWLDDGHAYEQRSTLAR